MRACAACSFLLELPEVLVNERDEDKCTPLNYAARVGNLEGCRLLLEVGGDALMTDNNGDSPLRLAAKCYPPAPEVSPHCGLCTSGPHRTQQPAQRDGVRRGKLRVARCPAARCPAVCRSSSC